ncbi:hypothetical protein CCR82_00215 [Halochromatium salexigens]|uniref:Uncharacterized protein n=1 Tax=Halochromatium salexigens TaxID=49447 RepID=A0AAJ0UCM5_HALSE|nr:hypothetical protein [Halochromatium salexigens]
MPQAESFGLVPLTHHAILGLVAPFSQRGHQVDLTASDRAQRRLRFKPIQHPDLPSAGESITETLMLDNPEPEHFHLRRVLSDGAGLSSTLEIEGTDPGVLLEQVEAIEVGRQIVAAEGIHIARSYRLQPIAASEQSSAHWRLRLEKAEAQVEGVCLNLNAKTGRKMPADVELRAKNDQRLRVPADLFAVLDWKWRPMRPLGRFWRGSVRIAADEPERTRDIEAKLAEAVPHLAKTLRSDPGEFHARWQSARWRVTFQRAIPMLIGLSLLGTAPLIQLLSLESASLVRMFIFHAPPLLMIGIFAMRELPVIEIPPLPRRLIGHDWIIDDSKGRMSNPSVQGVEAG